jgi:hypothetical protein
MDLYEPGGLEQGEAAFDKIESRLASEGGGMISIFYHPCEWVHQKFWDAVNFSRGANPPREDWKAPPQRPAAETEQAFVRFEAYIDHLRASPGVQFVTASQLPTLYPDQTRTSGATHLEALELARRLAANDSPGVDFQVIGQKAFSPADQFCIVCDALAGAIHPAAQEHGPTPIPVPLLGPDAAPPADGSLKQVPWPAFRDATLDAQDFVQQEHRIPARVFIGADAIAPTDFLVAMAHALLQKDQMQQFPPSVDLPQGVKLLTADHVVHDGPNVYGGWIIHRAGYQAPHILEVARLQAWTLKPAMRN